MEEAWGRPLTDVGLGVFRLQRPAKGDSDVKVLAVLSRLQPIALNICIQREGRPRRTGKADDAESRSWVQI